MPKAANNRVPGKVKSPSTARKLRSTWAKAGKRESLKAFARALIGDLGQTWFHNKRVNTSKLPLGLGRTRKRKGGGDARAASAAK